MSKNSDITTEYLESKGYVKFNDDLYLFPNNHYASIKRINPIVYVVDYIGMSTPSFHITMEIQKESELERLEKFIEEIIYPLPL